MKKRSYIMENTTKNYCRDLVREHDKDRFLLGLIGNKDQRDALWALFAFHHEIAKTREIVSDTTIGLIRLQWWRDALDRIYADEKPPKNVIVENLRDAIKVYDLPRADFDDLLYGREFDLEDAAPADIDGLVKYIDHVSVPLTKLCLRILGEDFCENARDVSRAFSLAGLLRAIPFYASHHRCYLPQNLLEHHDIDPEMIYRNGPVTGLKLAVQDIATHGHAYNQDTQVNSRYLKVMKYMTRYYLKRLYRMEYDVFDARLNHKTPLFYLWFIFASRF